MKLFMVLVLTVVALFVWQRANHPGEASSSSPSEKVVATPPPPAPSGHNWAKNSLDRTHEAIDQVSHMRQDNDRP